MAAAKRQTVFVFQGGGALGAYQAGVAEALDGAGIAPDWLVGTSIGAINAALIAGNPPARRLARLREFWARVTLPPAWPGLQTWQTLAAGVPGFFRPRPQPLFDPPRPLAELGYYDTAPLAATLAELVDFDLIATGRTRLTLCALDLRRGALVRFDSRDPGCRIGPAHVLASGALPPGFAPVQIGDDAFWDGGIYSNTPLDVVLSDTERRSSLVFMVDLWDGSEAAPTTMAEVQTRLKSLQYASRMDEQLATQARLQNLRRAVRLLGRALGDSAPPELEALLGQGCSARIDVAHLVMQVQPGEDAWRDIDFSAARLQARWAAGLRDAGTLLSRAPWRQAMPEAQGLRVHTL